MLDTVVGDSMRFLVIEDDAEMASFIQKVLSEAGHDVDTAIDGERGLKMARSVDFDATGGRTACCRRRMA